MNIKSIFSEALPIIESCAPSLASLVGGPVGMASGLAISVLAKAFGTHPKDFNGLASAILADPSVKDKLSALEAEHGSWLTEVMDDLKLPSHVEVNIKMDWDNS